MTRDTFIVLLLTIVCMLSVSCSDNIYQKGKITVKVVDESGKVLVGAKVGIGFEQYIDGNYKGILVEGVSNTDGIFYGEAHGTSVVSYGAAMEGYYESSAEYRFNNKANGKWSPWNPIVTIVMRKIEHPVSMYARKAEIVIPKLNKEIGFDLIQYDWIKPYGKGEQSDFVFKVSRNYISKHEFDGKMTITMPGKHDGIQATKDSRRYGSIFKLPRHAPETGYEKFITKTITAFPSKSITSDSKEDNNYFFRIRSEFDNDNLSRAMYGKIQGDFNFNVGEMDKARIGFKYFLNPDCTTNLEFDPKRNLFKNLKSFEQVGLE